MAYKLICGRKCDNCKDKKDEKDLHTLIGATLICNDCLNKQSGHFETKE